MNFTVAAIENLNEIFNSDRALFPLPSPLSPIVRILSPGTAWLAAFVVLSGFRMFRSVDGPSSLGRRAMAAAYLATLTSLPVAVWMTLYQPASNKTFDVLVPIAAWTTALLYSHLLMRSPVWISSGGERMPFIESGDFVDRVRQLAGRMGVSLPTVRLVPTVGGDQRILAWIGTPQAPQLVVTDGFLNRLTEAEADAIVAHELGHLANHTLWIYPIAMSISVTAGAALDAWCRWHVCVLLIAALFAGLSRVVSRWLEFDCDVRGALATSPTVYASALTKLYAAHSMTAFGVLRRWVDATSTHPSIQQRLERIQRLQKSGTIPGDAAGEKAATEPVGTGLSWLFFAIWATVIVGGGVAAARTGLWWCWELGLVAVAYTPGLLLWLAARSSTRLTQRRVAREWGRTVPVALLILLILNVAGFRVLVSLTDENSPLAQALQYFVPIGWLLWVVLVSAAILYGLWRRPNRRLRIDTTAAMMVHNFARVIELAEAQPKILARDPIVRISVAVCRAVLGDVPRACEELERLADDRPGFLLPLLWAVDLRLNLNQPERALELVERAAELNSQDPDPMVLQVRALTRLGRIPEACSAWRNLARAAPQFSATLALGALLDCDHSQGNSASTQVRRAIDAAPGDPFPLLVAAEVELRDGDLAQAESFYQQAVEAAPKNRFQFIGPELEHVRKLLTPLRESDSSVPSTCPDVQTPQGFPVFELHS